MFEWNLLVLIIIIAVGIGLLAALFGIGGGFLLVPTMILIVELDTHLTVGTSSFVIIFMALSSSIAYARQKRIDYKTTMILMIASLIGSVIGAWATELVSGQFILVSFGIVEALLATILAVKKTPSELENITNITKNEGKWYILQRHHIDSEETEYNYSANILLAFPFAFLAGFLSSLLGIGGGTLYIQIFVFICGMSIHMAIASSIFTILFSSIASAVTFITMEQVQFTVGIIYAIGVVFGAQLGAYISKKIEAKKLKKLAAIMIIIIAIRMIVFALIENPV
ncbi:MAG: TSUP family transporter [Candidatus Lokiarchaeota archaeon]|nr:TSUP family transporter [Candidatus Lokiarchaeota archaeon]